MTKFAKLSKSYIVNAQINITADIYLSAADRSLMRKLNSWWIYAAFRCPERDDRSFISPDQDGVEQHADTCGLREKAQ